MKINFFSLIFVLAAFVAAANAQSVVVTGKMVTYKRPKPISEYKKSFTINYPKIKASTPALSKKIEDSISYQKVLGLKLNDEINDTQWLEEADYEVAYNKNGILSIALTMDGSAAYPDGSTKHVVVDLKTGLLVKPADIFTNTAGLLAQVKKAEQKEVADTIVEVKKDPENMDSGIEDLFKESAEYQKVTLSEFSIDEKGVTFYHDYGFVHAVQALQPTGEFKFTWKELKPYIKAGGLLAHMGR